MGLEQSGWQLAPFPDNFRTTRPGLFVLLELRNVMGCVKLAGKLVGMTGMDGMGVRYYFGLQILLGSGWFSARSATDVCMRTYSRVRFKLAYLHVGTCRYLHVLKVRILLGQRNARHKPRTQEKKRQNKTAKPGGGESVGYAALRHRFAWIEQIS
jgi:hypothetical protein